MCRVVKVSGTVIIVAVLLSSELLINLVSYEYEHNLCRMSSFASIRESNAVKWLVDGKDYMSAVADAIKVAKHEILITGLQINPYVHLKRPDTGVDSLEWRLDKLLFEKANEGVQVYVLLYKEAVINLGNDFAVLILGREENITVLYHRDTQVLQRWSNHEKLVVVDRSVAFVGGIDLNLGQWDTHDHPLTDMYSCSDQATEKDLGYSDEQSRGPFCRWVGMDYSNTFLVGERTNYSQTLNDIVVDGSPIRSTIPRMPWHDVACMFSGESVLDVVTHFIQRFNSISNKSLSDEWEYDHYSISNATTANASVQVVRSMLKSSANCYEDSIHQAYLQAIEQSQHSIYIENQFYHSAIQMLRIRFRLL